MLDIPAVEMKIRLLDSDIAFFLFYMCKGRKPRRPVRGVYNLHFYANNMITPFFYESLQIRW